MRHGALILIYLITACASAGAVPQAPAAGYSFAIGGPIHEFADLNAAYEAYLQRLNPADENSITRALDFYHQNFTPQPAFQDVNDRGYRDFKAFYDDVVNHLQKRIESNPAGESGLLSKLRNFGLTADKGEDGKVMIKRDPDYLKSNFEDYVSPKMKAEITLLRHSRRSKGS